MVARLAKIRFTSVTNKTKNFPSDQMNVRFMIHESMSVSCIYAVIIPLLTYYCKQANLSASRANRSAIEVRKPKGFSAI